MKTLHSLTFIFAAASLHGAAPPPAEAPGDRMLAAHFRLETAALHTRSAAALLNLDDWKKQRAAYRQQLYEMLGLAPLPPRTPLQPVITGREESEQFTVEKLHFQAMPGLYVTANLYLPKPRPTLAPTILYLSGHARVREGTVSFGSKAAYQQHGEWYARHGYVCLTLDSVGELAEIEGQHHGLYSGERWWWSSRGYTPAGVETWTAMRALDYLETRPEVDPKRFGVTGRSGGGVGTWWLAAADERVAVAVPVAGMTDMHNQVIDGRIASHCDCMFMVNTYRWDFAQIGALIAPRPMLFSNSDKDDIFPLDGVIRLHRDLADLYKRYGASGNLGLLITEGPHKDTQDLQVPSFRWFNRFLKKEDAIIDGAAPKFFTPAQLKVFATIPADERNTTIDQSFVPAAKPAVPPDRPTWEQQRREWMEALRTKVFAGWPATDIPLQLRKTGTIARAGVTATQWEFVSQEAVLLPLLVFAPTGPAASIPVELIVLDEKSWPTYAAAAGEQGGAPPAARPALLERVSRGEVVLACVAPRGIGPSAWSGNDRAQIHIRRRFILLGETLDGMRAYDIRRALAALTQPELFPQAQVHVTGEGVQAINALYASLFAPNVGAIELVAPPVSHANGPDYLSVLRWLDLPQTLALAADRVPVRLSQTNPADWKWSVAALPALGVPPERIQFTP
jgi:dienelactone hydrolase